MRASRATSAGATPVAAAVTAGAKPAAAARTASRPSTSPARRPSRDQLLGEQHVQDGQQQQGVAARAEEQVAIGQRRGLGPAWIDHLDGSAAGADVGQAGPHVGRGHDAAVRHRRVAAEDDEVVASIEVGHRHEQLVAEHLQCGQHVWQLVDRGRAVQVASPELAQHQLADREQAEVVHGRVALVHAEGVAAVGAANVTQPARRGGDGLVPRGRAQRAAGVAHHRRAQPVGVVVQVTQRDRLGAQVPTRERIGVVAADLEHPTGLDLDGQAAGRLTQRAGAEVRRRHGRTRNVARKPPARPPGGRRPGGGPGCADPRRADRWSRLAPAWVCRRYCRRRCHR